MRFDSAMVADHFQGFIPTAIWDTRFSWAAASHPRPHAVFDYQLLLGYLAAKAGRLRLGVGVTEPIRRHPVLIAQTMASLAHAARARPILGIGAGERENLEPYGLSFAQPVSVLEEALTVIKQCFAGRGPLDFQGKHFKLDHAVMDLLPPKERVPEIWIAAHGPRMLRLTGAFGDGWYPTVIESADEYGAKLGVIRAAALAADRDPDAIVPALHQYILVAPTRAEARAMLDTPAVRFASLLAAPADVWRKVGAEHPFGSTFRGYVDIIPEQYDRPTLERAMAAVPPELVGYGLMWGTPEEIADQLRAFGRAGLRHLVLDVASAL
ncbi:MAG: LLM class flavin-dependent oxidoreductase, partial [Acidobacteria bacterium]|nr:LLM class flavin-dependent oxidoreductase [Acidobacteriota bacterium]